MTHTHFLRLLEARHWDVPYLYIAPIWADVETHQPAPSFLFDTPHHGLTDLAYRGTIDDASGKAVFLLCATLQFPDMCEMQHATAQMQKTHQALAELARQYQGEALSYGRRCAAWLPFAVGGYILTDFQAEE